MILYASTTNKGKLREFLEASKFAAFPSLKIEPLPGLREIAPPQETGQTFEENSRLKAMYYSRFVDGFVFADDSGLEVEALGGAPGVRSARYAGENATDSENNTLLTERLAGVTSRRARFICVVSLAQNGNVIHSARGMVEGEIVDQPRGTNGFGYDPLFFFPPLARTMAELDEVEKFSVSHRGAAFRELLRWIDERRSALSFA